MTSASARGLRRLTADTDVRFVESCRRTDGARHDQRRPRSPRRQPRPPLRIADRRSGHRGGHPRRHGDGLLRDGGVRLAHRDHADPQPVERAQRHHARRVGPARRAVGRHPAVHAHVDAAGALRARVPRRRASSARATCSSPTTRTTAAATSPTTTCSRPCSPTSRAAGTPAHGADREHPVPPRRHRRRRARRLQHHRGRHLGRRRALAGREGDRPRGRAPRRALRAARPTTASRATSATCARRSAPRSSACSGSRRSSSATAPTTVEDSVDYMIDYAARRFREEVAQWPDGVYEADAYVDHDPLGNPDVHLHVKVTVDGDALTIDFTGSDTRPELQAWSTYGNTRGYTVGQIASMMDPEIPKNEGFFEQIKLIVPQGCVLNPPAGQAGERGHAPSGRRRRRGHRGRDAARAARRARCRRPTRPASRRSSSASTRAPARRSPTTRPRSTRAGATRRRAWTRGARSTRASATSGRRPPRSTSRSSRTSSGAATTAPTPAGPVSGAASAAATTRRKCASTRRSTPTSSA